MNYLMIVESPTKMGTIKKFLNDDYSIVSTKGHLVDLKKYGKDWLGVQIENNFQPVYVVLKGKKNIIEEIEKKAVNVDRILIATDYDREGEAIAQNICDFANINVNKVKRIRFNEITKRAILASLENPSSIDMNLVMSQQARRVLDRILGFKLSGLIKSKIGSKSAGRVQSVALKLIVEKEQEREAFVPVRHFLINVILENDLEISYYGDGDKKKLLTNENEKNMIKKEIETNGIFLEKIEEKESIEKAPSPLKTSTLIQKASFHFGYSARYTMLLAQQLYEGIKVNGEAKGLITYMRTDSVKLSNDSIKQGREYLKSKKLSYQSQSTKKNPNKKFEQGAHEALRPTDFNLEFDQLQNLTKHQLNIYKLIWYYAMTSLMKNAVLKVKRFIFKVKKHVLIANVYAVEEAGYLKIMNQFTKPKWINEEKNIDMQVGQFYKAKKLEAIIKETKPPKRYSTASLVKKLEELGIGRPSTYAAIIKTLKDRYYVEIMNKAFVPTDQGVKTIQILTEHFGKIINENYTANIEKQLDDIAKGNLTYIKLLQDFYEDFDQTLKAASQKIKKVPPEQTGENCPLCGQPLVKRLGRYGPFIGCSNYPECKFIKKKELKKEADCPKCNGILVKRKSKKGIIFLGCSNYPQCKYVEFPKKSNN